VDEDIDALDWSPDSHAVDEDYLPIDVAELDEFSVSEDEPVPVFATLSLDARVGFARLSWDDGLTATLTADIDEDRLAQRLVPIVAGRQIVALAFRRRQHRHVHG